MKNTPPPLFVGRRYPFLFLLAAAIAGIVAARVAPFPSLFWVALTLPTLAWSFRQPGAFFFFGLSAFAALHLWQGRESPSAAVSRWIGARAVPAAITGTVGGEVRVLESGSVRFELHVTEARLAGGTFAPPVTILAEWAGPPPRPGDTVEMTGLWENLSPPRNPGQFDFAAWSALRQIHSRIRSDHAWDGKILEEGRTSLLSRAASASRDWMKATLTRGVEDPQVSDLLVAMVLGETSNLPEEIQEQFRGTGTYHLFSVSGLHVGMLAVLLWNVLRVTGASRRQAAWLVIPALFFYAFLTGWKPASVRAAIMASIVLAGLIARRQPLLFNNLCAAAFLLLLFDTNLLFNTGFQLSFAVVAAILLAARPLTRLAERPFERDPFFPEKLLTPAQRALLRGGRSLAGLTGVSAAAWTGSLPLTLGYFHLVSLSALPANLVAVPVAFGIMGVAMLSLLSAPLSVWVSEIFNQANWLLTHLLVGIVGFFAALPGSFIHVAAPEAPAPVAEITVFDFGAGGASAIHASGRTWMIDTGPAFHLGSTLLPFLRSRGRSDLDGLIVTHGDAGHISAAAGLLAHCRPRQVVESTQADRSPHRRKLHASLAAEGLPKTLVRPGDRLALSPQVALRVLHPPVGIVRATADDRVLVARLDAGPVRILFLSDATLAVEEWLLREAPGELRCDILVKGNPRSGPSGGLKLIETASPRVVIGSSAPFPEGQTIPSEFAAALADRDIRLFDQSATGAVTIRVFPDHWNVAGFLQSRHDVRVHE